MRNIFYSFHFKNDVMRVQQIRNIGVLEENKPVSLSRWEVIQAGGDASIQRWIDTSIDRASCVVVLIGEETYNSKWVKYEIKKAWNSGKGLIGIYIHNLKVPRTGTCTKGKNPFSFFTVEGGVNMSDRVSVYDPGVDPYNWIAKNIEEIVEKAIRSRK